MVEGYWMRDAGVGGSGGIGGRLMRGAGRGLPSCCVLLARLLYGTVGRYMDCGWRFMERLRLGTTFAPRTSIFAFHQRSYPPPCATDQRVLHPTVEAAKA